MKISENNVVAFHFTLKNDAGQVIESSFGDDPLVYMHGTGSIVPGLEEALEGRTKGDKFNVVLSPEKAYGPRDERLVQKIPLNQFPDAEKVQVGAQFQVSSPNGPMILTIKEVTGTDVVVDGNPEMAGQTLHFEIEVADVREASKEEVAHGHAHGPGGHHHHD